MGTPTSDLTASLWHHEAVACSVNVALGSIQTEMESPIVTDLQH